jgi:cell cycle serine/threonine-protein kinase CDC5/MSD2
LIVGYKAIVLGQEHNGRKVALKKDVGESSILLDLHHPNIIEFHGLITYNGLEFMVLDFCENSTLEDMIQARKYLTAPEAREFGIQIAGAIKYLHNTAHITHRGLETRDVLLDSNMNIKITGIERAARLSSPVDRVFDVPPTYLYMAPEMRDGRGHNNSVDSWSLGIIL